MKYILFVLTVLSLSFANAHPGRTNAKGCHGDKKSGRSHCHKKSSPISMKKKSKQNRKKAEVKSSKKAKKIAHKLKNKDKKRKTRARKRSAKKTL